MEAEEPLLLELERSLNLTLSKVSEDRVATLFKELYDNGYLRNGLNLTNGSVAYSEVNVLGGNISSGEGLDLDILSMCGNQRREEFWKTWQDFVFWCEGVILLLVGSMGCLGNIVAISVLSSEQTNWSSFHCLLIGLSICDLLFLALSMPIHAILNPRMTWSNWLSRMMPFCITYRFVLYPFCGVAYNIGVFVTMTITIERFQAVCFPHSYREAILSTTPLKRALKYIIPGTIIALILNIPKFLEVKIAENNGTVTCMASKLTVDETFVNWITITYIINPFFSTTLIPILVLFVMNACIYRKLIQTHHIGSNRTKTGQAQQSESKLQATLIIICVVFVITHFPRLVLSILAFSQRSRAIECASHDLYYVPQLSVVCMEAISNLLIHVNASFNFLIYSCNMSNFINDCRHRLMRLLSGTKKTKDNKNNTNIIPERIKASTTNGKDNKQNNSSSANNTGSSNHSQAKSPTKITTRASHTHNVLVHDQNATTDLKNNTAHLYINMHYPNNEKIDICQDMRPDRNYSSLSHHDQFCSPAPVGSSHEIIFTSAPTTPILDKEESKYEQRKNSLPMAMVGVLQKNNCENVSYLQ